MTGIGSSSGAGECVRPFSRKAVDWTARLPAIAEGAGRLKANSFTVDVEATTFGSRDRCGSLRLDPELLESARLRPKCAAGSSVSCHSNNCCCDKVFLPLGRGRDASCVAGEEVIEERVGVTVWIESGGNHRSGCSAQHAGPTVTKLLRVPGLAILVPVGVRAFHNGRMFKRQTSKGTMAERCLDIRNRAQADRERSSS
jgi:hypothetical protein